MNKDYTCKGCGTFVPKGHIHVCPPARQNRVFCGDCGYMVLPDHLCNGGPR